MLRLILLAALASGLLASCGGDDDPEPLGGHERVAVIEGWVEALSDGDVSTAADYFDVPSLAQNGTSPLTLRTRGDVTAFNRSLPCGAELVTARSSGRFINVTFRLTERPGGSCGPGAGQLARTAFVVKEGKIVQWRRLADPPGGGGSSGPIV